MMILAKTERAKLVHKTQIFSNIFCNYSDHYLITLRYCQRYLVRYIEVFAIRVQLFCVGNKNISDISNSAADLLADYEHFGSSFDVTNSVHRRGVFKGNSDFIFRKSFLTTNRLQLIPSLQST